MAKVHKASARRTNFGTIPEHWFPRLYRIALKLFPKYPLTTEPDLASGVRVGFTGKLPDYAANRLQYLVDDFREFIEVDYAVELANCCRRLLLAQQPDDDDYYEGLAADAESETETTLGMFDASLEK